MAIRDTRVVAIEGTHASGKTTLVHALVAHYRARGLLVDCTGEPARTSPFIEEIVIHGKGEFDIVCEADLFAAQVSQQLRASRHHELLICDKTVMNVVAYARVVLDARAGSRDAEVLDAIEAFCTAWAPIYDAVFYCSDTYQQASDTFRSRVASLQDTVAQAVLATCQATGVGLHHLPAGLTVDQRVAWVTKRVDALT